MASDDEDEYIFFGTPLQEEEESRAGQRRKDVKDPALTKQLPLHKQVQHLQINGLCSTLQRLLTASYSVLQNTAGSDRC